MVRCNTRTIRWRFSTVRTYLAEVLPKGALEVEQWLTCREGKSQGTYDLLPTRTEIEYGITSQWLASIYVNTYSSRLIASSRMRWRRS